MSFIENLYLKRELQKLQEENKNLKKILSEAPGDRLQRLDARYARAQYTRLPRHPYPGQHPTKYEGGWSLQLMPMYPPQEPYPYNRPDPYPGQHPVGKSTVSEAAGDGSFGSGPRVRMRRPNTSGSFADRYREQYGQSFPDELQPPPPDGALKPGSQLQPIVYPAQEPLWQNPPRRGSGSPQVNPGYPYGYWETLPNGELLWVPYNTSPIQPLNPGDQLPGNPDFTNDQDGSFGG